MKGLYKILGLTGSLYVLSCSFLSSGVSAADAQGENVHVRIPTSLKQLNEEGVYSVSEWKKKKWSEFLKSVDGDFKEFLVYLDNEKNSWLEGKDELWEQWKANMEKKWEHYDEYTFKELLADHAKDALTWNDKEWINWVSKKGRLAMKGDWNKWVNGHDVFFKDGINNDWKNWSDFKRKEFGSITWKYREDKFWTYWIDHGKPSEPMFVIKMEMFKKWQDRLKNEEEEWSNWLDEKQKKYIDVEWDKWVQWKKENNKKFIDWMEYFVEKWTSNKQWNVWIEERNSCITL
ncbi:tryptophan-rich antigen (Pv-fam-a) [Plasmodium vivax]|uniref:Tryptophan-rich antigen (Pv-fam-a) n=3 Tax=Plasmodium vivax TaxID=5855 RepID=A5KCP3_PLAVS|nr:tryptophan-rich antigen (Pv-fam-a) [Plasmodium vivax]EDL42873.1 tryptophan-rich antigen (Pv-fam-a) [Plasmodium vivax]KMZ83512.1 hypothetical protein PVBG_00594 [Plasmodium vivax Brazil I]|eukprot:XP_001612647.1 tryptophan-rich antigen (Pv-fam-a) [Plasmodium vivax Sal-1]